MGVNLIRYIKFKRALRKNIKICIIFVDGATQLFGKFIAIQIKITSGFFLKPKKALNSWKIKGTRVTKIILKISWKGTVIYCGIASELTSKRWSRIESPGTNPWIYGNSEQGMTEVNFQINRKRMHCLTNGISWQYVYRIFLS